MQEKFIVLVGDEESGDWTVVVNTANKDVATTEFLDLKADRTPAILICTGDFVTV